ncbi:MAG TPA: BTAD domain-containing putative transcriptional regulator [Actinocatenispora sp.]
MSVRCRVLGPVELSGGDATVAVTAPRQLVVLAMLLGATGRVVPLDRLVDAVWGETPPETARTQIQICVSAVRKSLHGCGLSDRLVTAPAGYAFRVGPDELDLLEFDERIRRARSLDGGDPAAAVREYRAGLALWRGPAFSGVDSALVRGLAVGLNEKRLAAIEECLDIELRLGRHAEVVGELTDLVATHPLRERLHHQRVTALYRAGRRAEALDAYRVARRLMLDELGLEPSPGLRQLERTILGEQAPVPSPAYRWRVEPPLMLPADLPDFAGRTHLLCELDAGLRRGQASAAVARVAVLVGAAGVGKTALAVHAAHRRARDHPDGQLHADLADGDPARVLELFLGALGVDARSIPPGLPERAGLYRSRIAGRRMLVVLDHAVDERSVVPLLPGCSSSLVLVTSRSPLTGLPGAARFPVGRPDRQEGLSMLAAMVGPDVVAAEPVAAGAIVTFCDGLPLALRIVAARLAARPHWTLGRFADRLAAEAHRLDELVHGGLSVRACLARSVDVLPLPLRRLFCRLAALGSAPFDHGTAAAVADPATDVVEGLARLVEAHLVEVVTAVPEPSYRLPVMPRLVAADRARPPALDATRALRSRSRTAPECPRTVR